MDTRHLHHKLVVVLGVVVVWVASACALVTKPPAPPPPTTAVPVPTTTPPPTTTTVPGFAPDFPGDVEPGRLRWGAAVGGNSDPAPRHEIPAGTVMGLHRTYFRWDQRTTSMISTASDDMDAGRLPWVSVKTPAWAEMAAGAHDDEIDEMLLALDGLDGPVWLTVWHEPENDPGTAADWRGMQVRVRQRMDALGTDNIAFAAVLMSWTYTDASGRDPEDWWVDGIWDFLGIDHYLENEAVEFAGPSDTLWNAAYDFAAAKQIDVALGEWGNRGSDAQAAAEMQAFYDLAVGSGQIAGPQIVGLAYFDSGLNSPTGSWELTGEPLARFHQLMAADTSLVLDG